MLTRTLATLSAAIAMSLALDSTPSHAQTLSVRQQGPWTITTSTLPGGSKALSVNAAGEIVGEGLSPDGVTVRPIWLDGATIGTLEGIKGKPFSWNTLRHAVGRDVVNSKISCSVWWTPTASGQLADCTGGAYDINDTGEAAGSARFTSPTIHRHVVTWRSGAIYRDIGLPPGAREAEGAGINDQGHVVGNLTDANTGRIEAFVHRNGQFTRLQSLPGPYATYAWDINNVGDIVGTSNGGTPVLWKAGSTVPTVLPVPAGRYPRSVARINDSGDIVGTATGNYPVSTSAVLWRGGEFIDLGVLPTGTESYAYDINNAGVIVGTSTTGSPYGWHAVTWQVSTATGADISLSLTGTPSTVAVGQSVLYNIAVTNNGPQPASAVQATGSLPTCNVGTLAAGLTVACTANVAAVAVGTLTQTMTASAAEADPQPSNNSATTSTTVVASGGADLSLSMTDAPDPVRRGSTLVYTLSLRNAGPLASTDVTVSDALPSSVGFLGVASTKGTCIGGPTVTCTLGQVQVGETVTITITSRANSAGMAVNTASASASTPDPATSNNTASAITTVRR